MFLLSTKEVIIATPEYLAKSERTIDMSSEELAQDYKTQIKAKMASAVFIEPAGEWANPLPSIDRRSHMAKYLASLKISKEDQDKVNQYISKNGPLRILFLE